MSAVIMDEDYFDEDASREAGELVGSNRDLTCDICGRSPIDDTPDSRWVISNRQLTGHYYCLRASDQTDDNVL